MYEIRAYKVGANGKTRISTIKKSGKWFGFIGWMRLWFTLRKSQRKLADSTRRIAHDCSPAIIH